MNRLHHLAIDWQHLRQTHFDIFKSQVLGSNYSFEVFDPRVLSSFSRSPEDKPSENACGETSIAIDAGLRSSISF